MESFAWKMRLMMIMLHNWLNETILLMTIFDIEAKMLSIIVRDEREAFHVYCDYAHERGSSILRNYPN